MCIRYFYEICFSFYIIERFLLSFPLFTVAASRFFISIDLSIFISFFFQNRLRFNIEFSPFHLNLFQLVEWSVVCNSIFSPKKMWISFCRIIIIIIISYFSNVIFSLATVNTNDLASHSTLRCLFYHFLLFHFRFKSFTLLSLFHSVTIVRNINNPIELKKKKKS